MFVHDHSELWRTRRCVPERGFLTTIQNMMDVAKLSAYLQMLAETLAGMIRDGRGGNKPCEDILRMVIPQIHRRRPPNRHTLGLALVIREQIRHYHTISLPQPQSIKKKKGQKKKTHPSSPQPTPSDSPSTRSSPPHSGKTTSPPPAHFAV